MTDAKLLAVLTDLADQNLWLDQLVSGLDEAGWRRPTPAVGWDVATSIGHLAWTDEVVVLAATDKAGWDDVVLTAMADPDGFVDVQALAAGAAAPTELLDRWRTSRERLVEVLGNHPPDTKLPWFGPPMSPTSMATARFMESWAHGLDVADALGVDVEPADRVRHVVHLGVRTRGFSFANKGLPVPEAAIHVALTTPGGELWEHGPADAEQRVTGSAWDFALLVTQRRHRADLALDATGPDAIQWLEVAQAFAGPRGGGRPRHD